jgi:hypothetical protein
MVLEAQNNTIRRVDFYVAKAKFYEKHRGTLNERKSRWPESVRTPACLPLRRS